MDAAIFVPRNTGTFIEVVMRLQGTKRYVATEDLQIAVHAAVTLERPLLIKGEPGTGKTLLAGEVSQALGKRLISWHIKSTSKAQQGLYEYDAGSRLRRAKRHCGTLHSKTLN